MKIQNYFFTINNKTSTRIFLNNDVEVNFISQQYVIEHDLKDIVNKLSTINWFVDNEIYCYEAYEISLRIRDSWNNKRVFISVYYVVNKNDKFSNITVRLSTLKEQRIVIDYENKTWRFKIDILKIIQSEKLMKKVEQKTMIYVIIAHSFASRSSKILVESTQTIIQFEHVISLTLSKEYQNFENVFSNEQARALSLKKNYDHVIKIEDVEVFFKLIYNLFALELQVLREYLNDVLTKKWIRHFISSTSASIFFVSKKNDELRFCMNYRELNKVILKNRYSLSLITQMLD